jgi:hypothetical protein
LPPCRALQQPCAPRMEPRQAISSLQLRMLASRASALQGHPIQLSAVISSGLRVPGAPSAQERELPHGRTSLAEERTVLLARRGTCSRESLDDPVHWKTLESALCCALSRCHFYVIFSSRVFFSYVIYSSADWLHSKGGTQRAAPDFITS